MPVHTNCNVEVGLVTQAKLSYVTRIPIFPRTLALQVTRAHARRDESYLDVPSLFSFLRRQLPHSVGTITSNYRVVASHRVEHLLLTSQQRTLEQFLTSPRTSSPWHSKTQEHTLRSSIYAFGLRCRLECVHLRQRGLRDIGVLSHEIVTVRVSRCDAHYNRYLLRIRLLCLENLCDKRPQVPSRYLC